MDAEKMNIAYTN